MNKKRRAKIYSIVSRIEYAKKDVENSREELQRIKNDLEIILREEEDYFDNMPENLQGSMRGEDAEAAIDYMTDALDSLELAISNTDLNITIDELDYVIDNLKEI